MDELAKEIMKHGRFEHITEIEDDYVDENYIPTSWLDDKGVRHAVIHEPSLPDYMRLEKIDGEWRLLDDRPF